MFVILMIVGLVAGLLSGSVGFGGGMILLPVITYFFLWSGSGSGSAVSLWLIISTVA